MSTIRSDAFVFLGATGDLAFKKIFPALQTMIRRGHLIFRIGMPGSSSLRKLLNGARQPRHTSAASTMRLFATDRASPLRYVDYEDSTTFENCAPRSSGRNNRYALLAIPPVCLPVIGASSPERLRARRARISRIRRPRPCVG